MTTIGHEGAVRRLAKSHVDAEKAKAVAMVAVTDNSLWCGSRGVERDVTYLLALFPTKLVLMHPTRRPGAETILAEFTRKTYRITNVTQDILNISFVLMLPYGQMTVRMLRRATYAVNTEVLEALVTSTAAAEKAEQRSGGRAPLQTAGDVLVFARMCAAFGPGAETATAVAEAQVTGGSSKLGLLARRPELLLATFADRLVLLDRNNTTHVASTPVAVFTRGACTVTVTEETKKHVGVSLSGHGQDVSLRITRYGEDRIDGLVLDAVRSMNGSPNG